ncbi:MAG: Hsp20/alpha crystallin family protein [Nanoarchaeota archaeon]|nr:Hsp20/alpha crystallin family protein [Nanoarchaeota archaeon]MBU4057273.1 Hsp20/alpha crystallin family protein [Patescibacteria group bacterium]MBU4123979.1 Hsp20/alpha crystallin family protein [Nanoarchaeota archaeon]
MKDQVKLWFEKPLRGMKNFFKKSEAIEIPLKQEIEIEIQDAGGFITAVVRLGDYRKDQVRINATSKTLEVTGQKEGRAIQAKDGYYKEEMSGEAERKIVSLPHEIDPNSVKAKFENGVANIVMQKKVERRFSR